MCIIIIIIICVPTSPLATFSQPAAMIDLFSLRQNFARGRVWQLWHCLVVVCGHRDQHAGGGGGWSILFVAHSSVWRENSGFSSPGFWSLLSHCSSLSPSGDQPICPVIKILTQDLTVKKSFRLGKSLWSRVGQKLKYFVRSLKKSSYICKSVRAFSVGRGRVEMLIKPPVLLRQLSPLSLSAQLHNNPLHNAKYQPFSDPLKINKSNWIKANFLIFPLTDWLTRRECFLPEQQWGYQLLSWPASFYPSRQRQIIMVGRSALRQPQLLPLTWDQSSWQMVAGRVMLETGEEERIIYSDPSCALSSLAVLCRALLSQVLQPVNHSSLLTPHSSLLISPLWLSCPAHWLHTSLPPAGPHIVLHTSTNNSSELGWP